MDKDKRRNFGIDCIRICCTFWIVYVWHYKEYCSDFSLPYSFFSKITFGVLATFFWISGYVADTRNLLLQGNVKTFIRKKKQRLYPLLLLSAMSLYIISKWKDLLYISSFRQLILTITFMAPIVGQAPSTLWYIDVLIIFYILIAIIIGLFKNKSIGWCLGSYAIFILLAKLTDFDYRYALYFPFFFWGYWCAGGYRAKWISGVEIPAFVVSAFVFMMSSYEQENTLKCTIGCFFIVMIMRWLGNMVNRIPCNLTLIGFFNNTTYPLYLFHRQIYVIAVTLLGMALKKRYLVFIIPLTLIVCYMIQELEKACVALIKNLNVKAKNFEITGKNRIV